MDKNSNPKRFHKMKIKSFLFTLSIFLMPSIIAKAHPKTEITNEFKALSYQKLYTDYLKDQKKPNAAQWYKTEINDLSLIPEASGPTEKYVNHTIIWAYDHKGNIITGFRPVNTTTGCKSGCTPVIFHLVIDSKGLTTDLLLEKTPPLRKVGHQEFTKDDYKKLVGLLKKLPQELRMVKDPHHLTDNESQFPPQTWTFFQDTLIKGGAYTSFAVYTASLHTKDFLDENPSQKNKTLAEEQRIHQLLSQDNKDKDKDYYWKILEGISTLLKTDLTEKSRITLLSYALIICANRCHDLQSLSPSEEQKLLGPLNDQANYFAASYQTPFFEFLTNLVLSPTGARFLLTMEKKYKLWNQIPHHLQRFLPYLAYAQLQDLKKLRHMQSYIDNSSLLNYVKTKAPLLKLYTESLRLLGFDQLTLKSLATLKARFPHYPFNLSSPLSPKWQESLNHLEKDELRQYRYELARDFQNNKETIPPVRALRAFHKKPTIETLPLRKEEKQVHIFFAPWCAHCFEVIKTLNEKASPEFWQQTQLVAVFIKDQSLNNLEAFLQGTKLKEKNPQAFTNIMAIIQSEDAEQFYEKNESLCCA